MSEIKTALIVDDSLAARMLMRSILAELRPNWATVLGKDGEDALRQTEATPVQVMFPDINMPGMDGFELATRLLERFPDEPIALCSANIQEKVRERARERGFHFVGKPLTQAKIAAFIDGLEESDD